MLSEEKFFEKAEAFNLFPTVDGNYYTYDELYNKIKEVTAPYFTKESLKEIHHSYSTNKCESLNYVVTKFLPKDKHLQGTICAKGCVYLAVAINSDGFCKTKGTSAYFKLFSTYKSPCSNTQYF